MKAKEFRDNWIDNHHIDDEQLSWYPNMMDQMMDDYVKHKLASDGDLADVRLSLLNKVQEIAFGDGSAQERMVDIKALFSNEA